MQCIAACATAVCWWLSENFNFANPPFECSIFNQQGFEDLWLYFEAERGPRASIWETLVTGLVLSPHIAFMTT